MANQRAAAKRAMAARHPVSTHELQAEVEGVPVAGEVVGDGAQKIQLRVSDSRGVDRVVGEYRMAEKIGLMPLLKFAHVSSKGVDSSDLEGLAALYDMVRHSIDPEEWDRFERDAIENQADDKEIFAVVQQAIEALAARPTGSPSGSRSGRRQISARSKASSPPTGTPSDELVSVDSLLDR